MNYIFVSPPKSICGSPSPPCDALGSRPLQGDQVVRVAPRAGGQCPCEGGRGEASRPGHLGRTLRSEQGREAALSRHQQRQDLGPASLQDGEEETLPI